MSEAVAHLLPPESSTPLERALSVIDGERLALYPPARLLDVLDPATCPAAFLPALAYESSVEEEWHLAVTEAQQRALIANAYALNTKKGTPFAIKRGLAVIGYPGVTLVEGFPALAHDRAILKRNGRVSYNSDGRWALFDVRVPLTSVQAFDDPERLRVLRGIEIWQRAACYLRALSLATILTVIRPEAASALLRAHIGLHLTTRRDTPRDGRYRRAGLRRVRYDGAVAHDGAPIRDGAALPLPGGVLRFGVQQVDPRLGVHLHVEQLRPPSIRFDAAILRDGSLPRGYNGALMRRHRRADLGGFSAIAVRPTLRDGSTPFSGALQRGTGVPAASTDLRTHRLLRHDGKRLRSGQTYDGIAARAGALHRDTAPRFTATGRITASVP